MLAIQKEERRLFHRENQERMKKLVLDTIHNSFSAPSSVQVVVSDEGVCQDHKTKDRMSRQEKEALFVKYINKATKHENTRILLGEILLLFEKQLKSNVICRYYANGVIFMFSVVINDAEFTADGEDFLKYIHWEDELVVENRFLFSVMFWIYIHQSWILLMQVSLLHLMIDNGQEAVLWKIKC